MGQTKWKMNSLSESFFFLVEKIKGKEEMGICLLGDKRPTQRWRHLNWLIPSRLTLVLVGSFFFLPFFFFKILFIYHERHTERSRDIGRGRRSRLHTGSPIWDSILELQDPALGWRQVLNRGATQASLFLLSISVFVPPPFPSYLLSLPLPRI